MLAVLLVLSCIFVRVYAVEALDLSLANTTWTNVDGSILTIEEIDENTGRLSGNYINKEEGYPCRDIPYLLTGWLYGNRISFSVKWQSETESCLALTSWIGLIKNNEIDTVWQLVNEETTDTSKIIKGHDLFRKN